MKKHIISSLKNKDGFWDKTNDMLKYHKDEMDYFSYKKKLLTHAILIMFIERNFNPSHINFYFHGFGVQLKGRYFIIYYNDFDVIDYTIYKFDDDIDRKNFERIKKIKSLL